MFVYVLNKTEGCFHQINIPYVRYCSLIHYALICELKYFENHFCLQINTIETTSQYPLLIICCRMKESIVLVFIVV